MRSSFLFVRLLLVLASISLISLVSALTYPVGAPAGETTGGTYRTYFDNMFPGCSIVGDVIASFTSTGVPVCVTPAATGLNMYGLTGYTLYYNGSVWTGSANIYNNNGNVGIGMTPSASSGKLQVNGQIMITGGTPGVGKFLVSDASGIGSWQSTSATLSGTYWSLSGNTVGASDYIGTNNAQALVFKTNGTEKMRILSATSSTGALLFLSAGDAVINGLTIGMGKGQQYGNTVVGESAFKSDTSGQENTAIGFTALQKNTTGNFNTANGSQALYFNTSGWYNTANGFIALTNNSNGSYNTANGSFALTNSNGSYNTANGHSASESNTSGNGNTADGYRALSSNTSGGSNVAIGSGAAYNITTGSNNIALGANTNFPSTTASNQLNIGNWIYGSGGNIGIGSTSPGQLLTVSGGTIQIISGTQGAGKFLVSDASGIGTWQSTSSALSGTYWSLSGNTIGSNDFIGSNNAKDLVFKTNNIEQLRITASGNILGLGTSAVSPSLQWSLALGAGAGNGMNGTYNYAIGGSSAGSSMIGLYNTAVGGYQPGTSLAGSYNLALGGFSAGNVMNGYYNASLGGSGAGQSMSGFNNVAIGGIGAGYAMQGNYNVALGTYAGQNMTTGNYNIYLGSYAIGNANQDNQFSLGNVIYGSGMGTGGLTNGRVGIGTMTPGQKLTISGGTIQIIDGTQGVGKILTSDASGVASWVAAVASSNSWLVTGNGGTSAGTNFVGTTDAQDLVFKTNGSEKMRLLAATSSTGALLFLSGGDAVINGITVGLGSGKIASNTVLGNQSFSLNTSGFNNTANGAYSLQNNTSGTNNTAIGFYTLQANTSGSNNTALGQGSLGLNDTGYENVSIGGNSLAINNAGFGNTAVGYNVLVSNATGNDNTANGKRSLWFNTVGSRNTTNGSYALNKNTVGSGNVAMGYEALYTGTGVDFQTAVGYQALRNSTTGTQNLALGYRAGSGITTGSNNIAIGYDAQLPSGTASNQLNIGNWIYGSGGNIGIGTSTPTTKLHVVGLGGGNVDISTAGSIQGVNINATNSFYFPNSNLLMYSTVSTGDTGNAYTFTDAGGSNLRQIKASSVWIGATNGGTQLAGFNSSGGGYFASNVGIGTISPGQKLTVSGGTIQIIDGNQGVGKFLVSDASGVASWQSTSATLSGTYWSLSGNTVGVNDYIGSNNVRDLVFKTNGTEKMRILSTMNASGQIITFTGGDLLIGDMRVGKGNGAIGFNTALGTFTLDSITTGNANTAIGHYGLGSLTSGSYNTSVGGGVLTQVTNGNYNTAIGFASQNQNLTASYNTSVGTQSMKFNTTGLNNSVFGHRAGYVLTSSNNILLGYQAGDALTTGANNIVLGYDIDVPTPTSSNTLNIGNLIFGTSIDGTNTTLSTGNIGIGTSSPSARLTVSGSALITSDLTVQGKVISDTFVNRTVNNVTISGSLLPDLAAPLTYRDIGNDTTQSWNNLYLSGQVKIKGGTPGAGKVLVSDANGLATWQVSTTSLSGTYWALDGNTLAAATAIGSNNLQDLILETNNTERMRVYSGVTSAGVLYNFNLGDMLVNGMTLGLGKGQNASNQVFGSTALAKNTSGVRNLAIGDSALSQNTIGGYNTAVGPRALFNSVDGNANTALGYSALNSNISGGSNTAIGSEALMSVVNAGSNTAIGSAAMISNVSGVANTAIGAMSLSAGGDGGSNTAVGASSMRYTTGGTANVAMGHYSLLGNTIGSSNTALGYGIMQSNQLGNSNTAVGDRAMFSNSNGSNNVAIGPLSLSKNVSGSNNTVLGMYAGYSYSPGTSISNSTLLGYGAGMSLSGGSNNTLVGFQAGDVLDSGTNNIVLGYNIDTPTTTSSNTLNIGNLLFGTSIDGQNTTLSTGNIGIGTSSPGAKLEVAGQVKITGGTPGAGKVLVSDAVGLASWMTSAPSATASGITGGSGYYIPKFASGGTGLVSSLLYDNGTTVAIGSNTATSIFEIWSGAVNYLHFRGTNNIGMGAGALRTGTTGNANTAFGNESLYTLTSGYSNSAFGHQALRQSTAGFNNSAFGKEAMYNDNDGTWNTAIGYQALRVATSSDYNVAIGGQALYNLGTGTGNVAIGHNALYGATSTASNNTVLGYMAGSGITSGWSNIAIGNGAQVPSNTASNQLNIGNWIYGSGGNIGIGTGASTALTTRLNIDSGTNGISGVRMNRLSNTSTTYTGASVGLGIDAAGNVVPISNGDVVVYTATNPASPPTPDPDVANRSISYDYNKYFDIPTTQSFVVSDGSSASYNGPFFRENGTTGVCSWNGTYGSSPYACSGTDTYGVSASPANSFTMTAKGSTFGYQLALGARGDAPLFARSGRFNGAVGGGLYTNDSPYQTPAPWQRVLTVPANHNEYLYINTGFNSQLQAISGGGMIGLGTTKPSSMLTLSGSTFPTITALTTTGSYLGLGSYASINLLFDNDSVQAKSDPTTSGPFYINSYGGNVNIGGSSVPSSTLEVNGTVKLGTNGTQLNAIIKASPTVDIASIAASACIAQTFTVTNAIVGGVPTVSPASALTDRLVIAYARVSAVNTVEAKFCNESVAAIDPPSMVYHISVIQ